MNTRFLLLVAVVWVTAAPAFAQSLYPPTPPMISLSGSSEVKVVPDEIDLRVGVETRNKVLDAAKQENDERIASSLKFLASLGIEKKDVQTDYISVEPHRHNNDQIEVEIYDVRKSIEVKLHKIDGFEAVLTGLLANGVNTVHGVEFRTTELRKYRDQARVMAIRAAREKADALVAELGVKRGKVQSINANEWGGSWTPGGNWGARYGDGMMQNSIQNGGGASGGGDEGTLSIGQISVSATVNVSFLIE